MKIYYNSKCSKCRFAADYLKDEELEIVEYLTKPLTPEELKDILQKLKMRPEEIVRKKEDLYKQFAGKEYSDDQWIDILIKNPKLMQRPIIIKGDKAIIGRSEESLEEIKMSN